MDPNETILNGDLKFADLIRARWPEADFTFRGKISRLPWWQKALTALFWLAFATTPVALVMYVGAGGLCLALSVAWVLGSAATLASWGEEAEFWVKDGDLRVRYSNGGVQPFSLSEAVRRYPKFDVGYFFNQARKAHEKSLTAEQKEAARLEEVQLNQVKAALRVEVHHAFDLKARHEMMRRAEALAEVSGE